MIEAEGVVQISSTTYLAARDLLSGREHEI
jgi:hypothetical protein